MLYVQLSNGRTESKGYCFLITLDYFHVTEAFTQSNLPFEETLKQ